MRRRFTGIAMLLVAHVVAAAVFGVAARMMVWRRWVSSDWFDSGISLWYVSPRLVSLVRPLVALPQTIVVMPVVGEHRLLIVSLAAYLVPFIAIYSALSFAWRRWFRPVEGCCKTCGYDLRATPDRCPECGAMPVRS